MKISAVSGDLVVKVALTVAVIGAAWLAVRSIREGIGGQFDAMADWAENLQHTAMETASEVVDTVSEAASSPWAYGGSLTPVGRLVDSVQRVSEGNAIYDGVNRVGGALANAPAGSWSLGSWLYDVTHPAEPQGTW